MKIIGILYRQIIKLRAGQVWLFSTFCVMKMLFWILIDEFDLGRLGFNKSRPEVYYFVSENSLEVTL